MRFVEGKHYSVDAESGCWLWLGRIASSGYGYRGQARAHRLAYADAHEAIPEDHRVFHSCRNPACVNPQHLLLRDYTAAMRAIARETRSDLELDDILDIRNRAWDGESLRVLAAEYGLHWTAVGDIVDGSRWSEVGGPIGRPVTYCQLPECGVELDNARHAKYCSAGHRSRQNQRDRRAAKRAGAR